MDDDIRIRYVSLPIGFDQSLDGIAYDYGDEGLGKAVRLLCACASQQTVQPLYMLNVTGEKGRDILSRRLGFDTVGECMRFVSALMDDGVCDILKDGDREYLHCHVVDSGANGYRKRCERSKKAAEARWAKREKDEGGEADQG